MGANNVVFQVQRSRTYGETSITLLESGPNNERSTSLRRLHVLGAVSSTSFPLAGEQWAVVAAAVGSADGITLHSGC